ncbi:MAG: prolyl oligopeptidase family serine peptidase [Verrucomicrobiota bacterium]|nr:prolyl oligopeptidase family serine peptidase [Verrucomicrobiota bacterium]
MGRWYLPLLLLITPAFSQAETGAEFLQKWVQKLYTYQPVKNVTVSPTGDYVAYMEADEGLWEIKLYHAKTNTTSTLPIGKKASRIESIAWDGPDFILIDQIFRMKARELTAEETMLAKNRLVIYQISTGQLKPVLMPKTTRIEIVYNSPSIPGQLTGKHRFNQYPEIFTFDWRTGATLDRVKNTKKVINWGIDASGICRLGETTKKGKTIYIYRTGAGRSWGSLKGLNGNRMIGFDASGETLYYASGTDQDNFGFATFNLKTKTLGTIMRDVPVDIGYGGTVESDPRTGAVIGYTYPAEIPKTYYVDNRYRQTYEELSISHPGTIIRVLGFLSDDRTAIVSFTSEVDQGSYHFYDTVKKATSPWIKPSYAVPSEDLSPVKPIRSTARDGQTVYSYLTIPSSPKPAGGYPLHILLKDDLGSRDYFVYNPEVQLYAKRGIAVLQINFRGSIGFGSNYEVKNFIGTVEIATTDIIDVTADVIKNYPVNKAQVTLSGRRLSASVAFRAVSQRPDLFTTVVGQHGFYDFNHLFKAATKADEPWIEDLFNDFDGNEGRYAALSPVALTYNTKRPIEVFLQQPATAAMQGQDVDLSQVKTSVPFRIRYWDYVHPSKMSLDERIVYFQNMLELIER